MYNIKKLSDTLNFKNNVFARFSVAKIGELIVDSVTTNFDSTHGKIKYVIKGKAIIEPQSTTIVTMVESSTPKTKPKPKRKLSNQPTTKEKRQKIVENQTLHKMPKGFNMVKCQKINNVMVKEYDNCFSLGIEAMKGVEILMQKFILAPSRIQSRPLCYKHKIKIKAKFMSYHKHLVNPKNFHKVYQTKLTN
jgi:hypothetical protein